MANDPSGRWYVDSAIDKVRIERLLSEGWEPFAARQDRIYVRRWLPIRVTEATAPSREAQ